MSLNFSVSLKINSSSGDTLAILTPDLPPANLGEVYSEKIDVGGGVIPYKFTVTNGTFPDGITMTVDGWIRGIPTVEGDFSVEITVTDNSIPSTISGPTRAKLEYLGCFGLNATLSTSDPYDRIGFSSGGCSIDEDGHFNIKGHAYRNTIAKFVIPSGWEGATWDNKPLAEQIPFPDGSNWIDPSYGNCPYSIDCFRRIDGDWAWFSSEYYNADNSNDPCFGYGDMPAIKVNPHSRTTCGHWMDYDGKQIYSGRCGGPISQLYGWGPILYGFDFDPTNPPSGDVDATKYIHYGISNPHYSYNGVTSIKVSAVRPDSVFQFGYVGLGINWYGDGDGTSSTDPVSTPSGVFNHCWDSKGYHSETMLMYCWVLDPTQDYAVTDHGRVDDIIQLPHDDWPCTLILGGTYHNGLLYLTTTDVNSTNPYEKPPMVHVLRIN